VREIVEGWPFAAVYAFFFFVALARSNATYWAGRGLREGGARTRLSRHLDRPAVARAEGVVRRYGAPAIALSFLTIGVQTVVNAAAGALRMPMTRYLPATVVGSLAWAAIYTTIGFTVAEVWLGGVSWWWGLVAVAVGAAIALASREVTERLRADRGR
jgi:membrane protein DedA with SNARE-associated domain